MNDHTATVHRSRPDLCHIGARASHAELEIYKVQHNTRSSLPAACFCEYLLPLVTDEAVPSQKGTQIISVSHKCCRNFSRSVYAMLFGRLFFRAWYSILAYRDENGHIRHMTRCGQFYSIPEFCIASPWSPTRYTKDKCYWCCVAFHARRYCNERREGLNPCWQLSRVQSVLSERGTAFLLSVRCVAGNGQNDARQVETGDKQKRGVQSVWSVLHTFVYISLVVGSALSSH